MKDPLFFMMLWFVHLIGFFLILFVVYHTPRMAYVDPQWLRMPISICMTIYIQLVFGFVWYLLKDIFND